MSLYDYRESVKLQCHDAPFYAFLMAAMRRADDVNLLKLRSGWPEIWAELEARYHAPGGFLAGDEGET